MMKKLLFFVPIVFVFMMGISLAQDSEVIDVEFEGEWGEGNTLYSDWISVENAIVYGSNGAYPIENGNERVKVCETKTKTEKERECEYNIYTKTRYKRVCEKIPYEREYRKRVCEKVQVGVYNSGKPKYKRVCEYETYTKTKYKRVCEKVPYEKEYRKRVCEWVYNEVEYQDCHWERTNRVVIGCMNPDGVYTNQLSLKNFYYTTNGNDWSVVPYHSNSEYNWVWLEDTQVRFKLEIPSRCSPVYDYDSVVNLEEFEE